MTVATFDTHAAVKALTEAGIDPAHAEAITDTVRDAATEGVATKTDLAGLEARFYRALWMQAGVIVAAIVALVKLLP